MVILIYSLGSAAYRFYLRITLNRRIAFIDCYEWPTGLVEKLSIRHPDLTSKDTDLISKGLKQFFRAYLRSGRQYVAMPSQAADDLWHEFILYTRSYQEFCNKAFGRFLHHTPAVVLAPEQKRDNEGLRRVWWQCCKETNIDPVNPAMLPLLFALDQKLHIPNGFVYHPNCKQLRARGGAGVQCGGDFASSSYDGGTDGFGHSGSDGADGVGADGGGDGGCGGGCGGGD
ncbi:MAG: hypothetical protein MnENMB40S_06660 [Rhizobiaceae bacterium MnEN-MB40S]|nr:MAG: hypothetical protein MnENMB40S_06660 [Rhizobiaceae bacterium MnEN-MB40S]